ncbi:MAG TPA: hypothetical protein VLB84_19720 [Bacteroidia bacterium]|nr:hypothetical protein [Bacteroidia bacterium]
MKTKITFFPIGNADTTLISLASGKQILWDFANMKGDRHCDLPAELNKRLGTANFAVACFTHGDEDHVKGMSEYFYLEHAKVYQVGNRKKIDDLWVPAALLLENRNDLCADATILQAEAKYRFLELKNGIKIFSKPNELKGWIEQKGISFNEVAHLIVDAGTCVPGWNKVLDGIEFFVHSPFKGHVDENTVIDRNCAAIIAQATFGNNAETKFMLFGDGDSDNLKDIVKISKFKKSENRLQWNISHLPHHCSSKAINNAAKGIVKTTPIPEVKTLFEEHGEQNGLLISPSDIILKKDTDQPPHYQAHNYYSEEVVAPKSGNLIVTMEYPTKSKPEPLEIEITAEGFKIVENLIKEEEKREAAKVIVATSVVTGNWADDKGI